MELIEWRTLLSEVKDLYFITLMDDGSLTIIVEDSEGNRYSIHFESFYSYKKTDEESCVLYWKLKTFKGWTFILNNAPLFDEVRQTLAMVNDFNDGIHYGIATWDCCIEVFADKAPIIGRLDY